MNESALESPAKTSPDQQPVEKSAFEDDGEEESDYFQQRAETTEFTAANEESKESVSKGKRRLSDAVEDKSSSNQTTTGTSEGSQPEELSAEEAQRRTDELIQKMLAEDQAINQNAMAENEDDYYDEETLPDEQAQIELIRRMRHNEVASETETTL